MGILQVPALTFTVVHLRPAKEQLTSWCHSRRVGRAVLSLSPETNTCLEDALWGASPLLLVLGARASHPLLGSSFQRGNMGFLGGVPLGGPDPPAHLTWGLHLVAVWPWALDLPPVHSSDDKAPYYMGDSAWYTSPECLLASEWQSRKRCGAGGSPARPPSSNSITPVTSWCPVSQRRYRHLHRLGHCRCRCAVFYSGFPFILFPRGHFPLSLVKKKNTRLHLRPTSVWITCF